MISFYTMSIFFVGIDYYIYVYTKNGTFQPSILIYTSEQLIQSNIFYVEPVLRDIN